MEILYKGFIVDRNLLGKDPHFEQGCASCHKGNEATMDKASAHEGLVKRPSNDLKVCGQCHEAIARNYKKSIHYTTHGQREGLKARFSDEELKTFDTKVFEKSCNSCHASCGDCHVKSPIISGVNLGLVKGHSFVKTDEGKTCALCHGGRVYTEFTGEYGGNADVHYQKGMMCLNCHKKEELHGDGNVYASRRDIKQKPVCTNCHKAGSDSANAKTAHGTHKDKLSCYACHSAGSYRNCYNCHVGEGSKSEPGFMLGLNPRDMKTVTTLRVVPTVSDTFKKSGIKMEHFDALPNYWDTAPHNIRKRTDRTRSCDSCHKENKYYLKKEALIKNGSKGNDKLLYKPKQN